MGVVVVPERLDERMCVERGLDEPPQNPSAPPVHDPDLTQPFGVSGLDVVSDEVSRLSRIERVQIEGAVDR